MATLSYLRDYFAFLVQHFFLIWSCFVPLPPLTNTFSVGHQMSPTSELICSIKGGQIISFVTAIKRLKFSRYWETTSLKSPNPYTSCKQLINFCKRTQYRQPNNLWCNKIALRILWTFQLGFLKTFLISDTRRSNFGLGSPTQTRLPLFSSAGRIQETFPTTSRRFQTDESCSGRKKSSRRCAASTRFGFVQLSSRFEPGRFFLLYICNRKWIFCATETDVTVAFH